MHLQSYNSKQGGLGVQSQKQSAAEQMSQGEQSSIIGVKVLAADTYKQSSLYRSDFDRSLNDRAAMSFD